MSLRDYAVPTELVDIDGKTSFAVRGISFEDLTKIVLRHGPLCVMIYQEFVDSKAKFGLRPEVLGQFISTSMSKFPEAVTDVIAIAADEDFPELREIVRRLPIGVQIDAIYKIVGLTFTGEADVKKLVEIVTGMAQSVTASLQSLTGPMASVSGSGSFVSQ